MSNLIEKIDDAILNIRQQENSSVLHEYNQWVETAEMNAIEGVVAYGSWLLKDMKDLSKSYLSDTSLLASFKKKVKNDRLVGVTSKEMEEAWPMLANYVGCMDLAKSLTKIYPFLKWDKAWELGVIKTGEERILYAMVKDLTHYETYAKIMSEKGYDQPINICCTDLIIKRGIIKNYLGEASSNVVKMMGRSIKKLRKLEEVAHEVGFTKDYNNWMRISESSAESGEYEFPFSLMMGVDIENLNIPELGKLNLLWGEIAKYQRYLNSAGEIVKKSPLLRQDYDKRKHKIAAKGRLNVICKMAMDIRGLHSDGLSRDSHGASRGIQELIILKEIFKLLEESKI